MDYNSPDSIGITLGRWAVAVSLAAEDHIYGQMGDLMGIGGKPGQVTGIFNIKPNEYMAEFSVTIIVKQGMTVTVNGLRLTRLSPPK